MERIDYAKSLVAMYQSPPSAASMDNPLCDVVHTKSGPRPVFPSKISVGSELAKLCNWHKETTKLEADDSILSFLDKVFGREDPPVRSWGHRGISGPDLENLESLLDQDSRWQRDTLSPAASAIRGARDAFRSSTQADHHSQGKVDWFQHAAWGRMLRSALLQPRAANKLDRPNARGRAPEVEKHRCEHWRSLRQV